MSKNVIKVAVILLTAVLLIAALATNVRALSFFL